MYSLEIMSALVEYNDGEGGLEFESYKSELERFFRDDIDWNSNDFIQNGTPKILPD